MAWTLKTVPSTAMTFTRVPVDKSSSPLTFQVESPALTLPAPFAIGSSRVNIWPVYCSPRRFNVISSFIIGLLF